LGSGANYYELISSRGEKVEKWVKKGGGAAIIGAPLLKKKIRGAGSSKGDEDSPL